MGPWWVEGPRSNQINRKPLCPLQQRWWFSIAMADPQDLQIDERKGRQCGLLRENNAVVYNEETMRARKKRIRTSSGYSCRSSLCFYSGRSLVPDLAPGEETVCVPWVQHWRRGAMGFVKAVSPQNQWQTARPLKEKILGPAAMNLKLTTAEEVGSLPLVFFFWHWPRWYLPNSFFFWLPGFCWHGVTLASCTG